jgi:hypothetical protein
LVTSSVGGVVSLFVSVVVVVVVVVAGAVLDGAAGGGAADWARALATKMAAVQVSAAHRSVLRLEVVVLDMTVERGAKALVMPKPGSI